MKFLDFHADTLTEVSRGTLFQNSGDLDLTRAESAFSSYVQVFAVWKNLHRKKGDAAEFRAVYDRAAAMLNGQAERIVLCRTAGELKRTLSAGKNAALLSLEDLELAAGDAGRIRDMGFSSVMLTWNYPNSYGTGAVFDQRAGLTSLGKEMAAALDRQGVLLDVSHLSDAGFRDLCGLTDGPLIASHSNCRSVCSHPRNLTDDQIREIIRRHGVIGLNLYRPFLSDRPTVTLEDAARHLDHLLELGGEDCAAMGCDFDGCGGNFPDGISGIQDMPKFWEFLRDRGYSEPLLEKLFFRNGEAFFMRALPEK